MAYVTKDEVKKYNGINWVSGQDTFIDTLIAGAVSFVENYTGRTFEAPTPDNAEIRYYDGNDDTKLKIDDLRELTSLTVDGVALTDEEDFYLYPLNAEADGEPYTEIQLIQPSTRLNLNSRIQSSSPYVFDEGQAIVEVNGKWGYSATPPEDIKIAVMKLVGGMIKENIGDADLREVTQESLGEYSTSYAKIKDIAHALSVDSMLDQYVQKKVKGGGQVIKV